MSAGVPPTREVEASIRAGTYEGYADEAVSLHGLIVGAVALADEPVDFGKRALDVGSRDGRNRSLIEALGPVDVLAVEPSDRDIDRGIRNGILRKNRCSAAG